VCINIGGDEKRSIFAYKRLWLVGGPDRINAVDANWEVSTIGIVTCYKTCRIFFFSGGRNVLYPLHKILCGRGAHMLPLE